VSAFEGLNREKCHTFYGVSQQTSDTAWPFTQGLSMKTASRAQTRISALTAWRQVHSPLGELLLARTVGGLGGLWFNGQKGCPGAMTALQSDDDGLLAQAARQLSAYFEGRGKAFDVPLDLLGSSFQKAVWSALLQIPLGCTASYTDIARQIGRPQAVRAVGTAVGQNPIAIIVPCHRVIGADGSLTGYAGGLDRKRALLALEKAL
jgi:methylated-DNA-[protein]-cysteine S-methyltransferase